MKLHFSLKSDPTIKFVPIFVFNLLYEKLGLVRFSHII